MTYEPPQYGPPPGYDQQPRHRGSSSSPWWRHPVLLGAVVLLAGMGIGSAIAASAKGSPSSKTVTVAGPTTTRTVTSTAAKTVTTRPTTVKTIATRTRTATVTFHPHYDEFGEGTYVVGEEIKPGVYHSAGSGTCYWARLSSLSGDLDSIIANNLGSGPQTFEVFSSDRAVQIRGGCSFGRA